MIYISINEVVEKWEKEARVLKNYCSQGKIKGAIKYCDVWFIPLNSCSTFDKDVFAISRNIDYDIFTPFIFSPIPARMAELKFHKIGDNDKKLLFKTELRLNQCNYEGARPYLDKLENSSLDILKMVAVGLRIDSMLSDGSVRYWEVLQSKLNVIYDNSQDKNSLLLLKELIEANMSLNFLRQEQDYYPEWLRKGDFSNVPVLFKEFAYYLYAMYLFVMGRNEELVGLLHGYIELSRIYNRCWLEIYMHLISAMNYIVLDRLDLCHECIKQALDLSLADNRVFPFVKFHMLLCGQSDKLIKEKSKEFYNNFMVELLRYRRSWLDIYTTYYGGNKFFADLTEREISCIILAKRGKTNRNISSVLGISVNTVKYHIANSLMKLGIYSRKEL